jgi:hypothetical protein
MGMVYEEITDELAAWMSLSGDLCAGHSMTKRSIYAKQDEEGHRGHGGTAVYPEGVD